MPYSSGTYTPPGADFPAVSGTVISSTKYNNVINDIASALTGVVTRSGQSPFLANIPAGGFKITGLGQASATADALAWGQHASVDRLTVTGSGTVPANGAYLPAANVLGLSSNSTLAVTMNATQLAVGLGTTFNAWGSTFRVLALGDQGGALWGRTDSNQLGLAENTYFDGTNFKYIETAPAVLATFLAGVFTVQTAPSGTAGATATFSQAFAVNNNGSLSAFGSLTVAQTLNLSAGNFVMGEAASRLVPGATSFSLRNNANDADNLIITNAGAATIRAGLTVTAGGLAITAGDFSIATNKFTVAAASGNTAVAGTLGVTGVVTFSAGLQGTVRHVAASSALVAADVGGWFVSSAITALRNLTVPNDTTDPNFPVGGLVQLSLTSTVPSTGTSHQLVADSGVTINGTPSGAKYIIKTGANTWFAWS